MEEPERLPPLHPGEILWNEFIVPNRLETSHLARSLKCAPEYLEKVIKEKAPLTHTLCIELAHYFDTSFEFWANMQKSYEDDCRGL